MNINIFTIIMTMPNSATSTHVTLIRFRGQHVNHADLVIKIRQSPIPD